MRLCLPESSWKSRNLLGFGLILYLEIRSEIPFPVSVPTVLGTLFSFSHRVSLEFHLELHIFSI